MDLFDKVMELWQCGYYCSQILAKLLLETRGEENEGFLKAMGGLDGGIGHSGGTCGCLTGGACCIAYLTGKAEDTGMDHPAHKPALAEFTKWFTEEITMDYGGIECNEITKGNPANRLQSCPDIICRTYEKCMEILSEKGLPE